MSSPPGRQIELTLLQERSTGTFAKVYLAEARGSDNLRRIVAVKVLKEQWSESAEILDRTYDEARLLARLHHKNILRVEALTELEGQPAIIMEFVDGIDIKQLIERLARMGERIPPRAAYKMAQDTASALEAAYFKAPYGRNEPLSVVHRDVKPSNIMVTGEGEVKVLDFGTARSNYEGRMARTGAVRFGSLKYMSPERREGDRGDHTSDVYALGLVLLEMLRGEMLPLLPLDATEHDEAVASIVASLSPLGLPNEQWEDSLRQTIQAMCASQATHRLNASQVVQLLRAFAEQASGPSLDTFAATAISPIAKEIYGVEHQGQFTGTRLVVSLSGTPDVSSDPARAGRPGEAGRSLMPGIARGPAQASLLPVAQSVTRPTAVPTDASPSDLYDADVMPTVVKGSAAMNQVRAAAAEMAASPTGAPSNGSGGPPLGAPMGSPSGGPPPAASRPVAIFQGQPSVVVPVEEEEEAPKDKKKTMLLVALVGVAAMFFLFMGAVIAGLAYYFLEMRPASNPVDQPATASTTAPEPVPVAAASAVAVEIHADKDALVQWIKLSDSAGAQVLKASPDGEASVPTGAYTLTAKIIGREAVKGTLTVDKDTVVTCKADDKGALVCTTADGTALALAP